MMSAIHRISLAISLIFLTSPLHAITDVMASPKIDPTFNESKIITVNSVEEAFSHIFAAIKNDPTKRIALSLDYDDTISLSKERLQRHYDFAVKQREPSAVDFAVKRAVENLNRVYLPEIKGSLFNWLVQQHQDKFLSIRYPEYIQWVMDQGISVFITTARNGTEFSRETMNKELARLKLNFNYDLPNQSLISSLAQVPITWGPDNLTGSSGNNKILPYFDKTNVLYTSGWDKGPVLKAYLQTSPVKFDIIFHLDDQVYQINSVFNNLKDFTQINALLFQPEHLQLFTDISSLNRYINQEVATILNSYLSTTAIDWTNRDSVDELLIDPYNLWTSPEDSHEFDEISFYEN